MEKMNFYGALYVRLEYFCEKKLPPDCISNTGAHNGWEGFTELFLSNIMKYDKNYIE